MNQQTLIQRSSTALLLAIVFGLVAFSAISKAQEQGIGLYDLWVCDALEHQLSPVDRDSTACKAVEHVRNIDPQARQVWVLAKFNVPEERFEGAQPLGLFVSAKASTEVFVNGQMLERNGLPAANKEDERAGQMDYMVYLPKTHLNTGLNHVALRMSSHAGLLTLVTPVHFIGVTNYAQPANQFLRHYWPTLMPFGVLLLGALCMSLLAFSRRQYWPDLILPAMSLFAACQLIAEVLRGVQPYQYWVHDLRLITILVFSSLFGIGLITYTVETLQLKRHGIAVIASVAATVMCVVVVVPGFDFKSALALTLPTFVALLISIKYARRSEHQVVAKRFAAIYGFFLLVVAVSLTDFLDLTFYYVIATLMVMLFVNEIDVYVRERNARVEEQARADRLQAILEQHTQRDANETIRVSSAGSIESIATRDIVYCKGAGDYVELVLVGDKSVLHSERLVELEKTLPSTFLRVHRSYIVNTASIRSLVRKPSGVGELVLANNDTVPVSRRIMPSVRDKLV